MPLSRIAFDSAPRERARIRVSPEERRGKAVPLVPAEAGGRVEGSTSPSLRAGLGAGSGDAAAPRAFRSTS
jgi:hypothetical protein